MSEQEGEEKAEVEKFLQKYLEDLTDQEVNDMAGKIYRNEIFTSLQVPKEYEITTYFLPILFKLSFFVQVFERAEKEYNVHLGILYGPMSSALPRGINGLPMLTIAGVLNKKNSDRVLQRYFEIKKFTEGK